MSLHVLLLLVSLSGAPEYGTPSDWAANGEVISCPASSPRETAYVRHFFAAEESRAFRERHGLTGITPGHVRPLSGGEDAAVCERMARAVTLRQSGPYPKVWRGYRAGGFYIMAVATEHPRGALHHGGGNGLIVLDANMNVVAAAS